MKTYLVEFVGFGGNASRVGHRAGASVIFVKPRNENKHSKLLLKIFTRSVVDCGTLYHQLFGSKPKQLKLSTQNSVNCTSRSAIDPQTLWTWRNRCRTVKGRATRVEIILFETQSMYYRRFWKCNLWFLIRGRKRDAEVPWGPNKQTNCRKQMPSSPSRIGVLGVFETHIFILRVCLRWCLLDTNQPYRIRRLWRDAHWHFSNAFATRDFANNWEETIWNYFYCHSYKTVAIIFKDFFGATKLWVVTTDVYASWHDKKTIRQMSYGSLFSNCDAQTWLRYHSFVSHVGCEGAAGTMGETCFGFYDNENHSAVSLPQIQYQDCGNAQMQMTCHHRKFGNYIEHARLSHPAQQVVFLSFGSWWK